MAPLDKAHAFLTLVDQTGSVASGARATGFSEQTIRRYLDLTRLPAKLQAELSTRHGPVGIESLSVLARTFPDDEEAMEAYERTRGVTGDVQSQILKQSEGDLARLDELAEQAREGLFNVKQCNDGSVSTSTSTPRARSADRLRPDVCRFASYSRPCRYDPFRPPANAQILRGPT
jgi:hypothetical protein